MGVIDQFAYLMDEAFEGSDFHSLISNLSEVDDGMWRTPLASSKRTIGEIVLHVGSSKEMYRDYAFGSKSLTWQSKEVEPWPPSAVPMVEALLWLRDAHRRLMAEVRTLTDADLIKPRLANWGEPKETRWLLSTLLQHDVYHAGEINRIRSVLAGEDRWQWQIEMSVEP